MAEPSEIVREALLEVALDGPGGAPAVERVRAARIELAPGQATGLHRHPCDVVGYVAAGMIAFAPEGSEPRTLRAGDAFHEPAGARIAHFDNASAAETATFVAFYLLPPGEDELIELLV